MGEVKKTNWRTIGTSCAISLNLTLIKHTTTGNQYIKINKFKNGIKEYINLARIRQLVLPIFGNKNLVVNWLVMTLKIPKRTKPRANSDSVISMSWNKIGVWTKYILKVTVAKKPCENVALNAMSKSFSLWTFIVIIVENKFLDLVL